MHQLLHYKLSFFHELTSKRIDFLEEIGFHGLVIFKTDTHHSWTLRVAQSEVSILDLVRSLGVVSLRYAPCVHFVLDKPHEHYQLRLIQKPITI